MKLTLAAFGLALLGVVSAQDTTPVSFTCKGARLREAVRLLAEVSKADLHVAEAIADQEVIVVRVDQVPLNQLMDRIALAVDGRWEQSGSRWTLVVNEMARRAQAAERRGKRLNTLRKQIAEALKPPKTLPAQGAVQERAAGQEDVEAVMGDRLVFGVLSTVDLGLLAELPAGGRIVFSTNPNRMQKPMRVSAQIIDQMVKEHNQEAALDTSGGDDPEMQKMREMMERWGMTRKKTVISEPPAKALLVVESGQSFLGDGGMTASLRLYGNTGRTLSTRSTVLFLDGSPYGMAVAVPPAEAPAKQGEAPKLDPGPKITWSPVIKELQERAMAGMFMGTAGKPWSEQAKEVLSNPDTIEPLQLFLGDGLVQVAEWKKWNLVASLPDDALEGLGDSPAAACGPFLQEIEGARPLKSKVDGSDWTITPSDPIRSRANRSDRFVIGKLVKKSIQGERLTLDDLGELALKTPMPMENPLGAVYLFTFTPSIMQVAFMPNAWEYLRLWGTLSANQRMAGGTRIAIGGLTPAQTAIANRLIFGANASLEVGPPSQDLDALGTFGRMMMLGIGSEGRETKDFREEPTELLPNGLPSAGFMQVVITEDIALRPIASGPGSEWLGFMGNLGVEDLALMQHMGEQASAAEFMPRVDRVIVGKRRNIELSIHVADGVRVSHKLVDDAFASDTKPIGLEGLSDDVKARMAKAVEKIKAMNLPFLDPSMMGRPPIPPASLR